MSAFMNNHTILVVFFYVMGLGIAITTKAYSATNHFGNVAEMGVIPDGRIVSDDFIVGEPTEVGRLFKSTTEAYDEGLMSNAVCFASEAIKRYEASKNIAVAKTGFMTPLLKTQMAYLYRIQAETLFASNEPVNAMGAIKTAIGLDSENITNQVVRMCIATCLDDYATQISIHYRFRKSPNAIKLVFFNELIKRGWLLPNDLTNEDFCNFENMLSITNRLDRPIYYTNKTNGHRIVHRWSGLDQFLECDFTELKKYAQNIVKMEKLLKKMQIAQKECTITEVVDLASNCLSEYSQLPSGYLKEHASLTMIPIRCRLALAEAFIANKEYESAMGHVLQIEQNQPGVTVDIFKTVLWVLNDKVDQATKLALKYKRTPIGDKMRTAYFSSLIETGYIADSSYLSDASFDIKTVYGLDCDIVRPMIVSSHLEGGGLIGNGEMLQQWTGFNTTRFEPFGPLRQNHWKGKIYDNSNTKLFCLDTLEVSNPSSSGLDVVLIATPRYEQVFSYIWNDPTREIGWYDFDTNARATNVFIQAENILWFGNPSAKLTRFTLRGAIELAELKGLPRNLTTHKVSSEPLRRTRWNKKRLGDDRLKVSWIKKELNLVPEDTKVLPYKLTISNVVIAVSTNGRPSIAQLRYVDKHKRYAKWFSPFSNDPSTICFGDIASFSANIPDPGMLYKVAQTTYSKGLDGYKEKILQILRITREDFDEESIVYCVSAAILILLIVIVNRLIGFACSRIWSMAKTLFSLARKYSVGYLEEPMKNVPRRNKLSINPRGQVPHPTKLRRGCGQYLRPRVIAPLRMRSWRRCPERFYPLAKRGESRYPLTTLRAQAQGYSNLRRMRTVRVFNTATHGARPPRQGKLHSKRGFRSNCCGQKHRKVLRKESEILRQ